MWSTENARMPVIMAIVATLLGYCSQPSEGLRILGVFPLNGKSHYNMYEQLIKGLAAKGHQLDVYSHFPQKKPIPNFRDFSLEGSLPGLVNNMTYDHIASHSQVLNMRKALNNLGGSSCVLMDLPVFQELLKNPPKDPPYDVVIVGVFIADCYLAWGRYLNIPMVGVMSSALIDWYNEPLGNPHNTAVMPGMNYVNPMNFWQRLGNTVTSKAFMPLLSYFIRDQDQYVERFFGSEYPNVIELRKDLDLLLVNTHRSLEGVRPYTPAIVPVAGMHIVDDNNKLPETVQNWLDESKDGCIYFSFGSMARIETFPKAIIEAFYATFKNIAPIRVLMKIAKPEVLPPGLPSNVMTQTWFSQIQVLKHKHIKAFVTHGGLLSSLEAIHCGVPMIGVPLFADQHQNVQNNVKKGISTFVELDSISEEKFTSTVKEILNNPTYKKNSKELRDLFVDRPMKPLDTAIFWVEYIARHGRKALRSPIVDMPWWQAALFDVYAFIVLVIYVIYYILKFLIKKIYNLCRPSKKTSSQNSNSKKNQ